MDGFTLAGKADVPGGGSSLRLAADGAYAGLRATSVSTPDATGEKKGTLADDDGSGNLARILDLIRGPRAIIGHNPPRAPAT
jgi:hypothetical protein